MAAVQEAGHETVAPKGSASADSSLNRRSAATLSGSKPDGFGRTRAADRRQPRLRRGLAASAIVNVGLVALVVFFATRPRAIPYVVAVDKTGAIAAVAQAVQPGAPISEDTIVRYQVAQFVRNSRAILRDPAAMKEQIRLAYALARGQAGQVLNDWYREHDPFEGARHGSVQVQIDSVLKLSLDSYEVRWTETPRDEQGTVEKVTQWRGVMKVETLPPDPVEILTNPLGLYITQIDWEEEQS